MLTTPQLCIELAINIFGVMTAYWVDYGMSFDSSEAQFRFPLAFQVFFAVLTFFGILVLPESPRWVCFNAQTLEVSAYNGLADCTRPT
jgi:hypothetical protein